jgi:hypothetical protein
MLNELNMTKATCATASTHRDFSIDMHITIPNTGPTRYVELAYSQLERPTTRNYRPEPGFLLRVNPFFRAPVIRK